ncbi:uncharacterized protein EKO05_0005104 [Ascochyta rabiei]|uniref:Uncharacterized protein n=1 Tax=Didymella rabiei TaxID=5454 RepID=A0A162WZL4_DIDRA|nr:uncharacterized protein EKO05_0005104 [Ascochyta rabiei]KZM19284.1 hypothetical protein ST47_g9572 [Ascochyta rabiei]UPX14627.1 hypothetical protein EKO05_0005104 [Ascochyta rabiei]
MHLNRTVETTTSFNARIQEVATKIREQDDKAQRSMKVRDDGELNVSAQQGEIFLFKPTPEFTALNREYFTQVWVTTREAIPDVGLQPELWPVMLRLVKGRLIIPRDHVGVISPIWVDTNTKEEIDIKIGDYHVFENLRPHTMKVLSGDEEVSIRISGNIPINLILHPRPKLPSPEKPTT